MYLLASLHPHIPISLCSNVLACILSSFRPHIFRFTWPCLHRYMLMFSGSCVLACNLLSSQPHILSFISVSLYPRILASSYSHVHVCFLVSLHPHILIILRFMYTCWYPRIITSSYPHVYACLLLCSHPEVTVFSIRINDCILASSSSLVLSNCASHFVDNLQILWTEKGFVLDFYRTSRRNYGKQHLRADLKKRFC